MQESNEIKKWWDEAMANNGIVRVLVSWWDADGRKSDSETLIPETMPVDKLDRIIERTAMMQLPPRYYRTLSASAWRDIGKKMDIKTVSRSFSIEGRKVDAVVELNLFKALFIETPDEANAVDELLTVWESFAAKHRDCGYMISLSRPTKTSPMTLKNVSAGNMKVDESKKGNAVFELMVSGLQNNVDLQNWVTRYAIKAQERGVVLRENVWAGNAGFTKRRVKKPPVSLANSHTAPSTDLTP